MSIIPSGLVDPKRPRPVAIPIRLPKKFKPQRESSPDPSVPRSMQVDQPFFPSQNFEVLKNTVEATNTVSHQVIIWETANEIEVVFEGHGSHAFWSLLDQNQKDGALKVLGLMLEPFRNQINDYELHDWSSELMTPGRRARLVMLFEPEFSADLNHLADRVKRAMQQKTRRGNRTRE